MGGAPIGVCREYCLSPGTRSEERVQALTEVVRFSDPELGKVCRLPS